MTEVAAPFAAQVNGLSAKAHSHSPGSVTSSSTKRKRDVSDDGDVEMCLDVASSRETPNDALPARQSEKGLIRDFFEVLRRHDVNPPILKRPLPDSSSSPDEPQVKRQKSEDASKTATIAVKVDQEAYTMLDDLIQDVKVAVDDQIAALRPQDAGDVASEAEVDVDNLSKFKTMAFNMYRREMAYPQTASEPGKDISEVPASKTDSDVVLTVYGNAPQPKHLFSSLARPANPDQNGPTLQELTLPQGINTTRVIPPGTSERTSRHLTLGELYASPRNLAPPQPIKATKPPAKGNVLGFYHPVLTDKSKYGTGSYFSTIITAGHWLDYSRATTKQRERASGLSGSKSSGTESEFAEMESLFRGAFSSFAPAKDDSAAIVPSEQVGRMWWQRVGHRTFQHMLGGELDDEEGDAHVVEAGAVKLDEAAVQRSIAEWDDNLIDPCLEDAVPNKSDHEKDVDETLQEISNMIETLASYQRNRNLASPTGQDRISVDPTGADILRQGSSAQQPSEDEMAIYEALRAQLSLIIQTLPPFAVARLNSDKLSDLNVSTKIEIRTDDSRGVIEEDEPAARARSQAAMQQSQQQAAAVSTPRQPHRAPSVGAAGVPYGYGPQYGTPSRTPMPNAPQYYQNPARPAQPPPMIQRPPIARPPPPQQAPPPYRPPNGYPAYPPQPPKPGMPFTHGAPYSPSPVPTPPRMGQPANYNHTPQPNTPQYPRYQPGFTPNHQGGQPGMPGQLPLPPPPPPPPHSAGHSPHTNGSAHLMQRPMPPQHGQAYAYAPSPQQPPRPPPPNMPMPPGQRPYPPNNSSSLGYSSFLDPISQQRIMDQARARATAHERTAGFNDKIAQGAGSGQVAGLAGIGLGGQVDYSKLVAARANMPGAGQASPSPKPHPLAGPPYQAMNGVPQPSPSPASGSIPPSSVSPAAGGPFPRPPM